MGKEIIICMVIVIVIIVGNIVTQNYTVKSVEKLSQQLEELKVDLKEVREKQEVSKQTKEKMERVQENWKERHNKLAYFIEHDELEKVEDNLTGIKSFIETQEYAEAISQLDKGVFILKHIEEKYDFNLENIF
ncbi:MAG: DUF4363 family protein [Clostridia bacterium]|nr:DUF4363 family protein [Clostridia bacterium]